MEQTNQVVTVNENLTTAEQKSTGLLNEVKTQPKSIPPLPGTGWSSETASPPPNPGPEVVNYEASQGNVAFPMQIMPVALPAVCVTHLNHQKQSP